MLSIITGRAKSGKTEHLLKLLKDNAGDYQESLLFVPEQFSFYAEKTILNKYRDSLDKITVVSFTSFCNELAGKSIDDSTRIMFIRKAINQLEGELQLFKTASSAINSIETLISAITEFKQAAVSCEKLMQISALYSDTLLGMKLHDIAIIMSTYDALIKNKYIDPSDDLDIAYKQSKNYGYFCDKAVYFDGFSGFTGQQYNIIKQSLIDSKKIGFAFCTDNKKTSQFGVFSNVDDTISTILKIADNVKVKDTEILSVVAEDYPCKAFKTIEVFLTESNAEPVSCDDEIEFNTFNNKYDEIEFIATEIRKLVRTKGYRYRDFAVLTGNTENYSAIAEAVFSKLEVPVYLDKKVSLIETPIAGFILSALTASKSFSSSEIIRYIKTGLTDFTVKEISDIDDYVFLWNIRDKEWEAPWQKNPFGLSETAREKVDKKLEYLNNLRLRIIEPLKSFNSSKTRTAVDFCKKLFSFLENSNLSKNLSDYVKKMQSDGGYTEAQYIISSWESTLGILDDIVNCYSEDEISLKEFIEILEFSFKKHQLGGIPKGLDEVYFAPANRIERNDFKIVFAFGLNYGEFPNYSIDSGLFNPYERGRLIGNSINISDNYISYAVEENYSLYKALTSWEEKLYLSYHSSDYNGNICSASNELTELAKLFGAPIKNVLNIEAQSPIQAFSNLIQKKIEEADEEKIKNILLNDTIFGEKIRYIESIDKKANDYINASVAKKLYSENVYTTASKIEQFHKCPYAYFIKFGLNISKPVSVDFKRMQRGLIVHYVLEKFIKEKLQDFQNLKPQDFKKIIDGYINEYVEKNVGQVDTLDGYSKYILERILELLLELVPMICAELNNSNFKPIEFEYDLNNKEIEPISLDGEEGQIRIRGVVDRFDMMKHEDKEYIRIVDYKSGVKKIKLSDILYGLNLQMFIYMSAICESEKFQSIPAGLLYQPINYIVREGTKSEVSNSPKVNGFLTDDVDILRQMDPQGKYMPFKLTANGTPDKRSVCISDGEFKSIFKYIKNKIIKMNDQLLSGKIAKDPCDYDSSSRVCDYCDYRDICGRSGEEVNRVAKNIPTADVLKIIEEENEG